MTDGTPNEPQSAPPPSPPPAARKGSWLTRAVGIAAAGALVVGFGGGVLTAQTVGKLFPHRGGEASAQADKGFSWPLFGKPGSRCGRAASTPRAPLPPPASS